MESDDLDISKEILLEREKNNAYCILGSKLALSYAGYNRIKMDLKFILTNSNYLKDLQESPEIFKEWFGRFLLPHKVNDFFGGQIQNIYFSSIIMYGKCFSSAEGRKVTLNPYYLKDASVELKSVHKNVIATRNKYIAHAGYYENDFMIPVLVYEVGNVRMDPPLVSFTGFYNLSMGNDIYPFIELINHLLIKVDEKMKEISEKILSEEDLDSLKIKALKEKEKRIKVK